MFPRPLDTEVDRLAKRLAPLEPPKVALFAACCAERMVGLYREFSTKERWGEFSVVRGVLDQAWMRLAGQALVGSLDGAAEAIESMTPHADDFRSLEALLAEIACICIDLAVGWSLVEQGRDPPGHSHASQYSLDAVRAAVCVSKTGYLELGDSPEGAAFEMALPSDPRVQRELSLQREDLADLGLEERISEVLVGRLRQRARRNQWALSTLLSDDPVT